MTPSSRGVWLAIAAVLLVRCSLPTQPLASVAVSAPAQQETAVQSVVNSAAPKSPSPSTALSLVSKYQPFHGRRSSWSAKNAGHGLVTVGETEFMQDADSFLSEHKHLLKRKKNLPVALLTTAAAPLAVRALRHVVYDHDQIVTVAASAFAAWAMVQAMTAAVPFAAALEEPKLCPLDFSTKRPIQSECVEHAGPTIAVCYDKVGTLRTVDFMGVCDSDGGNCMAPDAFKAGELWRLEAHTGKWKYFDGRGSDRAAVACGEDWMPHRHEEGLEEPREDFFHAFEGARSFFLHARQEHVIQGPRFEGIMSVIKDPQLDQLGLDKTQTRQWAHAGLLMLGYAEAVGIVGERLDLMRQKLFKYAFASAPLVAAA